MATSSNSTDDRFDDEAASGGSFVVGLLAGTVLGAGLAMIFGPTASLSSKATASAGEPQESVVADAETAVPGRLADSGESVLDTEHRTTEASVVSVAPRAAD